jgi:pimeloyl-ACP methyl ester carboxylesterase
MTASMRPFETTITGTPENPMLFFVHGWPDNASLWRKQLDALSGQFYCVAVTLPNFGEQAVNAGGYDYPQLIQGLAASIKQHRQNENPVTLVCHDWGAYMSYMLERDHPQLIDNMVALDVGGHARPAGFKEASFIIGYQWILLFLWLIGGILPPLGNVLSRGFAGLIRVPARQRAKLKSRFNYPYFYFWRSLLFSHWKSSFLAHYKPACPILYLYGERKPVMFHSSKWLKIVAGSGGRSEGISDAGHWFMETHPEIVNQAIKVWCQAGSQAGKTPVSSA